MSGAVHITFEDLKKSQAEVKDNDTRIAELELELKHLKASKDTEVSGLQDRLKVEKDRDEKEAEKLASKLVAVKE